MCSEIKGKYSACPRPGKSASPARPWRLLSRFYPLVGLLALLWFLLRVLPKPSRAMYPCQRAAAPLASSFVIWLLGLTASANLFRKKRFFWAKSRYAIVSLCLAASVMAAYVPVIMTDSSGEADDPNWYVPFDSANEPIGVARGYYPGRVVWVHDPNATSWSAQGDTNYWWLDQNTDQAIVEEMISKALCDLVNADNDIQAWQRIFEYFNQRHGCGLIGYQNGQKIAVKLNLNMTSGHTVESNGNFTAPQVVLALLRQLVYQVGVNAGDITFYDTCRFVPDLIYNRCKSEFPEVNFVDWIGGDGRQQVTRDSNCPVVWSDDLEDPTETYDGQPTGFPTFLPTCVLDADYLINIANLKGHRTTGITVCAKNHFGSFCAGPDPGDGVDRCVPKYAGVHPYVATHDTHYADDSWSFDCRDMGTYNPLVDLMCHKELGGKTLLYMIDALYAANHMNLELSPQCRWVSAPFNSDWTSSIFVSLDGVAIDSVALDFLRSEPVIQDEPRVMGPNDTIDNYLHEAAMAQDPPSGTLYDPEGDGAGPDSLGVHEHWNNAMEKLYSRNLRTGEGIELVRSPRVKGDINGNGVDIQDLVILSESWTNQDCGVSNGWCYGADINNDGKIDMSDFAFLSQQFYQQTGGPIAVKILGEPTVLREKDQPSLSSAQRGAQ